MSPFVHRRTIPALSARFNMTCSYKRRSARRREMPTADQQLLPPLPLEIYLLILVHLPRADMLSLLKAYRALWQLAEHDLYHRIVGPLDERKSTGLLCRLIRSPVGIADHLRVFDAYILQPQTFPLLYAALRVCGGLEVLSLPEQAVDECLTSYHPHLRALRTGGPAPLKFVARHTRLTALHLCDDELDFDPCVLGSGKDLEYLCVNHVVARKWLDMRSGGRALAPPAILNVFLRYTSRYDLDEYSNLFDALAASETCPRTFVVDETIMADFGKAALASYPAPYPRPNKVQHLHIHVDARRPDRNLAAQTAGSAYYRSCDVLHGFPNVETLEVFDDTGSSTWFQHICPTDLMKRAPVPKLHLIIWPDGSAVRLSADGEWESKDEESLPPSAIDVFEMEEFYNCFDVRP
ncbi:hypothetical protein EXIGLDRAFT_483489 [Exidia glandulosa HHB12029]|uniref:F-box domain-containing protein n=1 Tax=Exidia glandulosa HHB12029 TaxID=1314781 RepID=A0A165PIZ7_EXIGL|nr:hypothetical protein EXIGLDRAFT_483489 [Exidia glandulosa HHB12029]